MNMVIRRTLFVLMCLLASSLYMYGQIAVKTNVAMDAVAIPNLGVEVGLSKKLTLDVCPCTTIHGNIVIAKC